MVTNYKKLILLGIGAFALSIAPIQAMSGWNLFQRGFGQFKSTYKPFSSSISKDMMNSRIFNNYFIHKNLTKKNVVKFDTSNNYHTYLYALGLCLPLSGYFYLNNKKVEKNLIIKNKNNLTEFIKEKLNFTDSILEKNDKIKDEQSQEIFFVEPVISSEAIKNNSEEYLKYLKNGKNKCDQLLYGWAGLVPCTGQYKTLCKQYAELLNKSKDEGRKIIKIISEDPNYIQYINDLFVKIEDIPEENRTNFLNEYASEFVKKIAQSKAGYDFDYSNSDLEANTAAASYFVYWYYWYVFKKGTW